MFKKFLKRAGIVLFLTAVIFLVRLINGRNKESIPYSEQTGTEISNEDLKQLTGSGWTKALENQYLSVEINFDNGNARITNRENGYVWSSCPKEEEIAADSSNDTWKNNLQSPIVYNYVNDISQSDVNYGNVYSGNTDIRVYQLEDGVRVYFSFVDHHITLGYDLRLLEDYLEVSVPANLISDTGAVYQKTESGSQVIDKSKTFVLTDFSIFPYLGAVYGESDTEGYLFVPDGIGGIMDFSVEGNAMSQYVGHIYGSDLALLNNYDKTIFSDMNQTFVHYPVYGLVREGNSFVAFIDQGDTQADIIAAKKGVQTGFHSVYSKFRYRLKYKLVTNTATGDGYFTYSDFKIQDQRKILFHFDSGAQADYVHMAKLYRSYLIQKNEITLQKQKEPEPLKLYLIGGDIQKSAVYDKFLGATTFQQAGEILQSLKEAGVEDVDVIYTGWAKDGLSVAYPDRFGIPRQLGGPSGLKELSGLVHDLGYQLYLQDNYTRLYSSKGVSLRKDTVYNIQDNSIMNGSFANAAFYEEQMERCAKKYKSYDLDGMEEGYLGWFLLSDFNKDNVMDRETARQMQITYAKELAAKYGTVRLYRPSAYLVRDNVEFAMFPGQNYTNIIDRTVPFYAIALHGLVTYDLGSYNNDFCEPRRQFLEAIEYGANVQFHVTAEPTSKLMFGASFFAYSTEFAQWQEDIVEIYARYREFSEATAGKFIEERQQLAKDVVKVMYEDDITVVINYSSSDYTWQGTEVPANDFVVVR